MTNRALHSYPRKDADFYPTLEAERVISELNRHCNISGVVHEPAAGDGVMSKELAKIPDVTWVISTDIAPRADFVAQGAIEGITGNSGADWCVTNLPFSGMPDLMAHLLDVYPNTNHAYLVRASFVFPKGRANLIHNNPRFAGTIAFHKRLRWFKGGNSNPAIDYVWIVFRKAAAPEYAPVLAFENGPAVNFNL